LRRRIPTPSHPIPPNITSSRFDISPIF
jgi:hypothetical protein